jgi:hypothetical protein
MTVKVGFHPVKSGAGVTGYSFQLECDHCHGVRVVSDLFYVVADRLLRDLVAKAELAGFTHSFVDGERVDLCPMCREKERKSA